MNKIIKGDCLEVMKDIPDKSVDSIVTDPPYELGFMGKSWDSTGIANDKNMWSECLRVLKPGGHLLAFSGTRTYHRMAVAIEDAGFEVRDMIEWVYGSGFPKSLNIGKAVDKLQGNDREITGMKRCGIADSPFGSVEESRKHIPETKGTSEWEGWGTALKPAHEPICMARKPLAEKTVAENVLKYGTGGINIDESRVGVGAKKWSEPKGGIWNESVDNGATLEDNPLGRFPANLIHDNSEEVRECFPETKTGGSGKLGTFRKAESPIEFTSERYVTEKQYREPFEGNASRFFKSIKKPYVYSGKEYEVDGFVKNCKPQAPSNYNDEGSPARYFKSIIYQAKASKSERNKGCEGLEEKLDRPFEERLLAQCKICGNKGLKVGAGKQFTCGHTEIEYVKTEYKPSSNNHPTVKPIALMEYLIKMVTPKGGIVLDPFAGSGSTLVAAKQNGYQYIGIELTEEYIPIINARLTQDTNPKE